MMNSAEMIKMWDELLDKYLEDGVSGIAEIYDAKQEYFNCCDADLDEYGDPYGDDYYETLDLDDSCEVYAARDLKSQAIKSIIPECVELMKKVEYLPDSDYKNIEKGLVLRKIGDLNIQWNIFIQLLKENIDEDIWDVMTLDYNDIQTYQYCCNSIEDLKAVA